MYLYLTRNFEESLGFLPKIKFNMIYICSYHFMGYHIENYKFIP